MSVPTVVFVLGPPGAGKGTQCTKLAEKYGFCHLSAGELLRSEVKNNGPDGDLINSLIVEGSIVPSSITVRLLLRAMTGKNTQKFLIDGFPRNQENIDAWNEIIGDKVKVKFMLFYECNEVTCAKRVLERREERRDDTEEVIRHRIKVYNKSTVPVIDQFKDLGLLRTVDASFSVIDVFKGTDEFFKDCIEW